MALASQKRDDGQISKINGFYGYFSKTRLPFTLRLTHDIKFIQNSCRLPLSLATPHPSRLFSTNNTHILEAPRSSSIHTDSVLLRVI